MPNKNYLKGIRKERKLVQEFRDKGCISARTAGSHSPIDLFAIDKKARVITFIQAKPDSLSKKAAQRIHDELDFINGEWIAIFEIK